MSVLVYARPCEIPLGAADRPCAYNAVGARGIAVAPVV